MHQLGISDLMLRAFLECLILVGIHAYLGLHVIRRKVIFVDLALAQVAALGTTVGFVFGMAPDSTAALLFSMMFTFVAAALFAITRTHRDRVPQEAIIGVVFAIAASLVILVVDRAPHGAEHIKEVMTGAILWVKWDAIILAAIAYSAVGLFHYIFRKPILAISEDPSGAKQRGMRLWVWDFWFYLSFGLVISISVRTAGVLLVFVFLVVPAIIASLITHKLKYQLIIGWSMGLLVTVLGLGTSYVADMPAGPSVVAFYGVVLGLAAVIIHMIHSESRTHALLQLLAGTVITAGLVAIVWTSGHLLAQSSLAKPAHEHHEAGHKTALVDSRTLNATPATATHPVAAAAVDTAVASSAIDHHRASKRCWLVNGDDTGPGANYQGDVDALEKAFKKATDPEAKLAYALHIACHNPKDGAKHLLQVLKTSDVPFVRDEALSALSKLAGEVFPGVDPDLDAGQNTKGFLQIENWIKNKFAKGTKKAG